MKNLYTCILLLSISTIILNGCNFTRSASINNQHSPTVQPTDNTNASPKPTFESSPNSKESAESNLNSNASPQTNKNEIITASEKTVQAFYKALKARNRREALKFAKPEVVRRLFNDKESKLDWRFIDCEEPKVKEYGDVACIYFFDGGGIGLFLRKDSNERYQIVSTYYMADD